MLEDKVYKENENDELFNFLAILTKLLTVETMVKKLMILFLYTVCFNSFGTLYDGITLEVIEIILF